MMRKVEQHTESDVTDAALRQFVGYNMKRAFNVLQADLARTLEPFGLRMLTFSALSMIVENPGLRPSQLAGALSVERANVVVYVDRLEEAGWVTRAPCADDRRAYALQCTIAGRRVYDKAVAAVRAHDRRMLDGLRAVEIAAVKKALARIEGRG
ncbi:MarR family transcriptional regulator [uncultured Tateyamaria sp.]|uniref:MarR family winged helix-turn-helix transcriptional regulator n=1 Tax=uncultured Tateyamaria sp. TaxID=455651 RepID=UPI0026086480|nr:MarR family transcriptional regulator [uncultured Tateyamaria sp.]